MIHLIGLLAISMFVLLEFKLVRTASILELLQTSHAQSKQKFTWHPDSDFCFLLNGVPAPEILSFLQADVERMLVETERMLVVWEALKKTMLANKENNVINRMESIVDLKNHVAWYLKSDQQLTSKMLDILNDVELAKKNQNLPDNNNEELIKNIEVAVLQRILSASD